MSLTVHVLTVPELFMKTESQVPENGLSLFD